MKRIFAIATLLLGMGSLSARAQYMPQQQQMMMPQQQQMMMPQQQMMMQGQVQQTPYPPSMPGAPVNQPSQTREGEVSADQSPNTIGCNGMPGSTRINRDGFTIDASGGGSFHR